MLSDKIKHQQYKSKVYILRQVNHIINTNMEKGMQNYNLPESDGVTHTWDIIQREVQLWTDNLAHYNKYKA